MSAEGNPLDHSSSEEESTQPSKVTSATHTSRSRTDNRLHPADDDPDKTGQKKMDIPGSKSLRRTFHLGTASTSKRSDPNVESKSKPLKESEDEGKKIFDELSKQPSDSKMKTKTIKGGLKDAATNIIRLFTGESMSKTPGGEQSKDVGASGISPQKESIPRFPITDKSFLYVPFGEPSEDMSSSVSPDISSPVYSPERHSEDMPSPVNFPEQQKQGKFKEIFELFSNLTRKKESSPKFESSPQSGPNPLTEESKPSFSKTKLGLETSGEDDENQPVTVTTDKKVEKAIGSIVSRFININPFSKSKSPHKSEDAVLEKTGGTEPSVKRKISRQQPISEQGSSTDCLGNESEQDYDSSELKRKYSKMSTEDKPELTGETKPKRSPLRRQPHVEVEDSTMESENIEIKSPVYSEETTSAEGFSDVLTSEQGSFEEKDTVPEMPSETKTASWVAKSRSPMDLGQSHSDDESHYSSCKIF